jgi:hypothetical protein
MPSFKLTYDIIHKNSKVTSMTTWWTAQSEEDAKSQLMVRLNEQGTNYVLMGLYKELPDYKITSCKPAKEPNLGKVPKY